MHCCVMHTRAIKIILLYLSHILKKCCKLCWGDVAVRLALTFDTVSGLTPCRGIAWLGRSDCRVVATGVEPCIRLYEGLDGGGGSGIL